MGLDRKKAIMQLKLANLECFRNVPIVCENIAQFTYYINKKKFFMLRRNLRWLVYSI